MRSNNLLSVFLSFAEGGPFGSFGEHFTEISSGTFGEGSILMPATTSPKPLYYHDQGRF